ncbi:MAG: type II secretion system GspH family protein [bacterium]|nr:type II secretion system GspH family protein [bacterium]
MKQQNKSFLEQGFSLIELLLVVAIVLILGTLTTTFYSRFLNQNAVANTSDQMLGQLRKAQMYSMMSKQNTTWGVRYSANKITLFATGNTAFDESFSVNESVTVGGLTSIIFTKGTGVPDVTPVITINSPGNNSRTITVTTQGVASR